MFVVDAFIVNVAIPTIRADLHASPAQIEAVIAVYLISTNAAGVAMVGALFFTVQQKILDRAAILAALTAVGGAVAVSATLLQRMHRGR